MSLPKLSTAREVLARYERRIDATTDPRHKAWLKTYRDHWWGEVINDVEMVMDTMSHGPISYTFDGHPFMTPEDSLANITDRAGTRAMYEGVVELGVRMAGPVDDERIFFDEHGIAVTCVLSAIYPGVFLTKHTEPVDPAGFYLARWPNVTIVRFDEDGLMMGEDIFNGAPVEVRQVRKDQIDSLVDGPLPAAEETFA